MGQSGGNKGKLGWMPRLLAICDAEPPWGDCRVGGLGQLDKARPPALGASGCQAGRELYISHRLTLKLNTSLTWVCTACGGFEGVWQGS